MRGFYCLLFRREGGRHLGGGILLVASLTASVFYPSFSNNSESLMRLLLTQWMQGTLLFPRTQANHAFYGQKLSSRQLLFAEASPPTVACKPLFDALHHLELLEQWTLDRTSSGDGPPQTVEHQSADVPDAAATSLPSSSALL